MGTDSAKVLLSESNQQRLREFILNDSLLLSLPALSSVPWIGASKRRHVYKKTYSHNEDHHIKFITKNDEPYSFHWQTSAEKLKQGVRWGIVKTHSISSKVIATLGQYRLKAHERAMKGMVSNSQAVKLKLLDLYQDRFTALQALESLVNQQNTVADYEKAFEQYISELDKIAAHLDTYFAEVNLCGLSAEAIHRIHADLQKDKARAHAYLKLVHQEPDLSAFNRARGERSVLEFVKQQMVHGLYEFQGINQDMTYSHQRTFALTRGELNDFIEDARKVVDDHEADPRNAVTAKHHGNYSTKEGELFTYNCSNDEVSSAAQQQMLMTISFIEGWDILENKNDEIPYVKTGKHIEYLDTYQATRWRTHRNVVTALKSFASFAFNIVKGIFVSTRPWEEEAWENKEFHLYATKLRAHVKPIQPMWKKPIYFLRQIAYAVGDVFNGIRDFGAQLIIHMPDNLINDWDSSQSIPGLEQVLTKTNQEIQKIHLEEERLLAAILDWCEQDFKSEVSQARTKFADVEYELSVGEYNDLFNSMVRGVTSFSSVFTHNIYAKDPVGGLVFTTTYLIGIGMIYMPAFSASIFGSTLVNSFNNIAYTMASTPMGAVVAGASTLAEVSAVAWDGLVHGPSGIAVNTLYQFGEDPLTVGAYCVAAYTLGYLLANGVLGYKIPWLSDVLREDLGSDPSTGYPIIGAKFAVMLYESLLVHPEPHHELPQLAQLNPHVGTQWPSVDTALLERYKLILWLTANAKMLPKLEAQTQFALVQQIERLFSKEESNSLKKLLYPDRHLSIAFQIFSIPLAYVPVVLRVLLSPAISFAAWVCDNPSPIEPMRRAGDALIDKVKKDLSRLLVVANNITYLFYSLGAALVKMISYLGIMSIGRIAASFDMEPAHATHSLFAESHNALRTAGEYCYPARALKSVAVAHPTDTMLKTEHSYVALLQQLIQKGTIPREMDSDVSVAHFDSPLAQNTTPQSELNLPEMVFSSSL